MNFQYFLGALEYMYSLDSSSVCRRALTPSGVGKYVSVSASALRNIRKRSQRCHRGIHLKAHFSIEEN